MPEFVSLIRFIGELPKLDALNDAPPLGMCLERIFSQRQLNNLIFEALCAFLTVTDPKFGWNLAKGALKLQQYFDSVSKYASRENVGDGIKLIIQVRLSNVVLGLS